MNVKEHANSSNRRFYYRIMAMAVFLLALTLMPALLTGAVPVDANAGSIHYVDVNATGANNGSSWDNAYTSLQDALHSTIPQGDEIWIAEGTYYPDVGTAVTGNDRGESFTPLQDVPIHGGFAGTESTLGARTVGHPTILSGDIDQNGSLAGNSYHVVWSHDAAGTLWIDGVTITGGNADNGTNSDIPDNYGGGVYVDTADLMLTNVIVSHNKALKDGGGLALKDHASLRLTNSTVDNNSAHWGGGLYCYNCDQAFVFDTAVTNNTALVGGGAYIRKSRQVRIDRSVFSGNTAAGSGIEVPQGGGVYLRENDGAIWMINTLVSGNSCHNSGTAFDCTGGGVVIIDRSTTPAGKTHVVQTTIVGNVAYGTSGGDGLGGGMYVLSALVNMENSIVWGNEAAIKPEISSIQPPNTVGRFLIGDSVVRFGCPFAVTCTHVSDQDPEFVLPISATSALNTDGNYHLILGSPALDTGSNSAVPDGAHFDLDGNPRITHGTVDPGAYELPIVCPATGTTRLMVKAGNGGLTGASWSDALSDLQDALTMKGRCGGITEIWVAGGVYSPNDGSYHSGDDRNRAYQLANGLAIYGGFAGTESSLSQRDWRANVSVLSGDVGGNDTADAHGVVTDPAHIVGENSYHVITGVGTNSSAILDGFTITAGQANGSAVNSLDSGAGLFNDNGSPTLSHLIFEGNFATEGGGLANTGGSAPALTNVEFISNLSSDFGGGMHNEHSSPTLVNVLFSGNKSDSGGGIFNLASSPVMINVTLSGNNATSAGGGILNITSSKPSIENSIVWNNRDASGTGTASASIHNNDGGSLPKIQYSLVQGSGGSGSWTGSVGIDLGNNIDSDPLFVSQVAPSSAPSNSGDYRLAAHSPAIDVGKDTLNSTSKDLGGNPRIADGDGNGTATIDMGPYEAKHRDGTDIAVHKTASTNRATVGDTITYDYQIVNNGSVTLNNIVATDDRLDAVTLSATTLAPGAASTGTLTYTVLASDLPGPLANTVTASGDTPTPDTVNDTDSASVALAALPPTPGNPAISAKVTADKTFAAIGETITYTYVVTNTGDEVLDKILAIDSFGHVDLGKTTLAPAESASVKVNHTVTPADVPPSLVNMLTVLASPPVGADVHAQDQVSVGLPSVIYLPIVLSK